MICVIPESFEPLNYLVSKARHQGKKVGQALKPVVFDFFKENEPFF